MCADRAVPNAQQSAQFAFDPDVQLLARHGTAEIQTLHYDPPQPPWPAQKSTPAGLDQTDRGYAERCGDRGLGDPPGTIGKDTAAASVPACSALSRARVSRP